MGKKIITLLLALTAVLSLAVTAHAAGYSDVPESHWAANDIAKAQTLGLFQGVGDGKFGMGQPLTRASFVTALGRLFRWESVGPETPSFSDVAPDAWYYAAAETAIANEALPSVGTLFRPNAPITREEMAVMLIRSMGYASLAGSLSEEACPFADVTVNRGFITMAYDMGVVSGLSDGSFGPRRAARREEAAVMLVRVYDRLWAASQQVTHAAGPLLSVTTPAPDPQDEMPITPLEPMADLYRVLRDARRSYGDLRSAAVVLNEGGVCTIVSGKKLLSTETFTKAEVDAVLAKTSTHTYYSHRYDSAYCIYQPNSYQTGYLWYQSPESLEAKLTLARLFGVNQYMFQHD